MNLYEIQLPNGITINTYVFEKQLVTPNLFFSSIGVASVFTRVDSKGLHFWNKEGIYLQSFLMDPQGDHCRNIVHNLNSETYLYSKYYEY